MSSAGMLVMLVMVLVIVLIVLIFIYFFMPSKSKPKKEKKDIQVSSAEKNGYSVESVFKFMNFERIEDNMIVQKKGKKFLMVVECQGINYDLMSEVEKNAVESGYIGFLNSLKSPIQIHIQTRTINLEKSISNYKDRLKDIEKQLIEQENQLNQMQKTGNYSTKRLNNKQLEVVRLRNLYAYGKDVIRDTESMSLNRNILRKKYYIVASYYYSSTDSDELLSESEIKDVAFSELYTRCQSMVRVLSTTGVTGKVLDSYELADLLYNAYNRDGAEVFGINKAEEAGYDELYVTSPDIMDKKIKAIDSVIEEKALELAEDAILKVNEQKKQELEEKEQSLDELVSELAKSFIGENRDAIGVDIAQRSIEHIEKTNKKIKGKEVDIDANKEKTRKRTKKQ